MRHAAIAAGGVLGAAVRWAVVAATGRGVFPWPVLAINIAGSIVLGVVLAEEWTHPRAVVALRDFAGIGFCGGLTTFSTFAVELVELVRDGRVAMAWEYGALSVVGALAGVVAGAAVMRRVRALTLPVEGP